MRIFALLLFLVAAPAHAVNYFNWGVETVRPSYGVNGASTQDVSFATNSSRDCAGVARSGSCSMKLIIIGNDSGNQQRGADLVVGPPAYPWDLVGSNALYYRFWMRINTGFSWGAGTAKAKSSRVSVNGGTYPRGYTGYMMSYGVLIGECEEVTGNPGFNGGGCLLNDGSPNTDSNLTVDYDFTAIADSTWREFVVMVKPNTSASCTAGSNCDAVLKLWVNNVLIGTNSNWKLNAHAGNTFTEGWGGWMVYPYFQLGGTAMDGGTIYLDDFSTDTVYNGLTAKPGNVRVTDLSNFMRYSVASYRTVPYL